MRGKEDPNWWKKPLSEGKNPCFGCRHTDCGNCTFYTQYLTQSKNGIKEKKVSLRIRRQYYDDIVAGKKKVELRRDSLYWRVRLLVGHPRIAVFVCGRRVHSRRINKLRSARTEDVLGRKLSAQGMADVGERCIAIYLGDEVKESDHVSIGGGTEQ